MPMDALRMRAVLERWFPGQDISVSRAGTGVSTPVFRVRMDSETFWARLGEEPGERRDGEVAAHRLMAGIGLPVPHVLRYEAAPPELDRSIALGTPIPGVPISTLPPAPWLRDAAVEVGRILARINAIQVPGFGWAHASERDGIPVGQCLSRGAWVKEYWEALRKVEVSNALPVHAMRAIATAVESWASEPDSPTASLVHGDLDASPLYVDPEHRAFTGIIDFGELRGAGHLYDLGHLLLHDGEDGRPELFADVVQGYMEIRPLPGDVMGDIRREAIAIGTRALSIQLGRPPSPYREWLMQRLSLLAE